MKPIEASEERNAAMETEGMRPPQGLNHGWRTRQVSRFTERADRGMSLFGTQPHTLKARLWSMNLDGPVF
jgi:hypothetical protein